MNRRPQNLLAIAALLACAPLAGAAEVELLDHLAAPTALSALQVGQATGLGLAAARLPEAKHDSLVCAWLDGADAPKPHVALLFTVHAHPGATAAVQALEPLPKGAAPGLGLAAGQLGDPKTGPELILVSAAGQRGATMLACRVGADLTAKGAASWGQAVPTPLRATGEVVGIGADLAAINRGPRPDLVVAWLEKSPKGLRAFYAIGFDLDAKGAAAKWSSPLPVQDAHELPRATRGFGVAVTQVDRFTRPDAVFTALAATPKGTWAGHFTALNLDPAGKPWAWTARSLALAQGRLAVAASGAAALDGDNVERVDVLHVWAEAGAKGAVVRQSLAHNPWLARPVTLQKSDFAAVAPGQAKVTDFSVATMKVLQDAQVGSAAELLKQLRALLPHPRRHGIRMDKRTRQASILDITSHLFPRAPDAVKTQIQQFLLEHLTGSKDVAL